jgi:hypothetical protein
MMQEDTYEPAHRRTLLRRIRLVLAVFTACLIASGVTARL